MRALDKNIYWSQRKVFFFGIAALFPERLEKMTITKQELDEYTSGVPQAYFEFEKYAGLFIIKNINQTTFYSELQEYLQKYLTNKLSTGTNVTPELNEVMQIKLLKLIKKKYPKFGDHQVLEITDLWNPANYTEATGKFWELILNAHINEPYIEIMNMDHEGIFESNDHVVHRKYYVDFRITPLSSLKFKNTLTGNENTLPPTDSNIVSVEATIRFEGKIVVAELSTGEVIKISKALRSDSTRSLFMNYLLSHPRQQIGTADIEIATSNGDITDMIAKIGFTKKLKAIFFPHTTEKSVYLLPKTKLNQQQLNVLKSNKNNLI